jgi:hypothetical protein
VKHRQCRRSFRHLELVLKVARSRTPCRQSRHGFSTASQATP